MRLIRIFMSARRCCWTTGEIVTGANFENASYGMTLCAETVAIAKGEQRRSDAADCGDRGGGRSKIIRGWSRYWFAEPITPCGRCRQVIKEVADEVAIDLPVHCAHASGHETHLLSELLPHGFGPANLKS
jgi:cytidine deaminase